MKKDKSPKHKSKSLSALPCNIRFAAKHVLFLPTAPIENWRRWIVLIFVIFTSINYTSAQVYDSINTFMQRYDYENVLEKIDNIKENDSDLYLLALKATAMQGLNKYQEAIHVYEKLFKNDTTDLRNIIELAKCYQSLGNYKNAQIFYQKAININPSSKFLYQKLADVYYQDNDYTNAIKNYSIVFVKDSTYYLSKQLAKCFENIQKTDTSIYFYRKAINLNPVEFITSYSLANLLKQKKDYEEAISISESFLTYDSTNLKMLKLNGYLNFLNKAYKKAIASFEKCIYQNDTSDFTIKYLGYSYFKAKEFQKAKDYLENAFQKDTTNIQLCYALGLSCYYSIYKKLGIQYLNNTIELTTPSPEFLSQVYQDLAAANTGFYQYSEALNAYLKAYELNQNDTLLIFKIASHYDNWIKDKSMALEFYQVFMETRPKDRKPLPKMPISGGIVVSYYDFVVRRMEEIKEELFWQGEKPDSSLIKTK